MRDATVLGLTVFFTGGHPFRFPDSLTRLLSRFPASHCMVGDRRGVFDPSFRGEGIRRYDAVLEKYPWLLAALVIPCPNPINPAAWPVNPSTKTWLVPASLARFYSGGRLPRVNNCVDRVSEYLIACGVDVPRSVVTCRDLYEHTKPLAIHEAVFDAASGCFGNPV